MSRQIIDPNLSFRHTNFNRNTADNMIIHHALARNCTVWDVHRWHLDNGWAGIGYHFFVNKAGEIYSGRKIEWSGAHCPGGGMNRRSIGICLEGCYQEYLNQTDRVVPQAQFSALVAFVQELMAAHGIPLSGIYPHSQFSNKLCPGNYFPWTGFIAALKKTGESRKTAADRQGGSAAGPGSDHAPGNGSIATSPAAIIQLPTDILRRGGRGSAVKLLQEALNDLGHEAGAVDGIFGPQTERALRDFQERAGITVDGIAGPQTYGAMRKAIEAMMAGKAQNRATDVFRVRVDGTQVIALTGYENARSYAVQNYPGKRVSLENTRTNEVYALN